MAIYYSAATGGFYDTGLHATIPQPACQISREDHARLLSEQADGRQIVADANGFPVAVERGEPSIDEALTAIRLRRDKLLAASDFTQVNDSPLAPDIRDAWAAYRQALRDLPEAYASNPLEVIWPEQPGAQGEVA